MFQDIGKEPEILQSMFLGRMKLTKIINNVTCPYETERISETLRHNKFSVLVDETESLSVKTDLLQLINFDASDCSAQKIFTAFYNELIKKQIPLSNIIGLECDNASVMTGKNESFQTKLSKWSPRLITIPCICHSFALVASNACKALSLECGNFIKKLVAFIRGSPKRTAIFKDFQKSFTGETKNILKYAETRWLSRYECIKRILEEWDVLLKFLLEQTSEKVLQAEELLIIMEDSKTRAYLMFLEHILNKLNSFNAFFQAKETKIQRLYQASLKCLIFMATKFIKSALLKLQIFLPYLNNIDFSKKENQLPIDEIDIGSDCAEYLDQKLIENKLNADEVKLIREKCLSFLITATEEIRDRFPIMDPFFKNLNILNRETALLDEDRETSSLQLIPICHRFGIFEDEGIKQEWMCLYSKESSDIRNYWSKLSFDDMWKAICSATTDKSTFRYPKLRSLLNLVRSLPHSNAEAERCFSIIPDCKTKKRNTLGHDTLNSICVIKYALMTKEESSFTMTVTKDHLNLMSSNTLYLPTSKERESNLNLRSLHDLEDSGNDENEFDINYDK
ncbi:SCAN domain-containing protein 3-like [Prorops nasuta]|uniref:SCAN domain-containing protein 3-like n=1 Tax=Prorops nasuta TaxID=863751 RepID=UPI0034CE9BB1